MWLILHEFKHVLFYFVSILILYLLYKPIVVKKNIIIGLIATILIDLDHFFDYFIYKGIGFNLNEFTSGIYFTVNKMVIVPLHSWELICLIFLLFLFMKDKIKYGWVLFIAVGMFVHVAFDAFEYGFIINSYLLTNRILNDFSICLFETC